MADKAEQIKNQGNAAFQKRNYKEAVNLYTQALKIRKEPTFYQNRATAYFQMGRYQDCVVDAEEALKLDPDYIKAHQKKIEGLYKQNKLQEALPIAEQLFLRDQTSRTRELVTEVRRAHKLVLSETESFPASVNNGIVKTLQLIARIIGYLSSVQFPILSTQKRQESMQESDKYELARCEIIQSLANFREQMLDCGMKKITEDFNFLNKNLPLYRIEPAIQVSYYLLMHVMRETAESFGHYSLEGFQGDEQADHNFFLNKAGALVGAVTNKVQKLVLQTCFQLLQRQLDQAKASFKNLAAADKQFNAFIAAYKSYEENKEKGTNLYKAQKPGAEDAFKASSLSLLNYETLPAADSATLSAMQALLHLSARFLAAQSLSNEGMAWAKNGNTGKALALLSAAIFVDQRYMNAYIRAGQLFKEKQMFAEARIEYSAAQALNPPNSLENVIKECQQQEQRYRRKDYYALLGMDKNIDPTSKEYQKKYKLMCVKWHPDSHQRGTAKRRFAEQKFRQIQEANGVLTDKQKKMIYDQGGDPNNSAEGGFPAGMDFSQFVQMGGGPGGARQVFIPMDAGEGGFGGFPSFGIDISQIFSMMSGHGSGARSTGGGRGGRGKNPFDFDMFQ